MRFYIIALSMCFVTSVFSTSVFAQMSQEALNNWLLNASLSGDITAVLDTIKAGADVNVTNEQGCTPLMYAFGFYGCSSSPLHNRNYYEFIIHQLFEAGADLNSQEEVDHFLLMSAKFGNMANVNRAFERGANVDGNSLIDLFEGRTTPFIEASKNCHPAAVRALLLKGADIFAINGDGETALDAAERHCSSENSSVVSILRDAGVPRAENIP